MISAEWHPDDERLLTRYLEGADPSVDAHVAWCRSCARRLSETAGTLDSWHEAAAGETTEAFDEPRLQAQRRAVQQRLGAALPARVLLFPASVDQQPATWLIRAAAAVLLVALTGAGMARMLQMPDPAPRSALHATSRETAPARLARDVAPDAALEDIELALMQPRTAELRALDAFTPHVRDISVTVR